MVDEICFVWKEIHQRVNSGHGQANEQFRRENHIRIEGRNFG